MRKLKKQDSSRLTLRQHLVEDRSAASVNSVFNSHERDYGPASAFQWYSVQRTCNDRQEQEWRTAWMHGG